MLKLYASPGSCSLASHIALEESKLPYEMKIVSFDQGDTETPQYLKLNPNGAVPVLEVEPGVGISEGVAILQYIADQAPNANLFPKSGMEKVRGQEWLNFISTEIHKGTMTQLFMIERLVSEVSAQEELNKNVRGMLATKLKIVNDKLEGKNFTLGSQFSVVDAYLFTILSWSDHLKVDLSPYKNIKTFQSRVFERPAVQAVMKSEDLL
jgi:glutathione S-transferase